jgi:hypothetical protein
LTIIENLLKRINSVGKICRNFSFFWFFIWDRLQFFFGDQFSVHNHFLFQYQSNQISIFSTKMFYSIWKNKNLIRIKMWRQRIQLQWRHRWVTFLNFKITYLFSWYCESNALRKIPRYPVHTIIFFCLPKFFIYSAFLW